MLWLKHNNNWNEVMKCGVSGDLIGPGDFYYVDDQDGLIIKATVYKDIMRKQKEETWDYTKINSATNQNEYKKMLQEATRQMLASSVVDRKVAGRADINPGEESDYIKDIYNNQRDWYNE